MNAYYTAQEAMARLKKPRSTFFKEVEEGLIPFEIDEGRQRGRRFPKEAIDALAERQKQKRSTKNIPHLIFSPSSLADTWAEVQIGISLYGDDDIVPYNTLLDWRDINDQIQMSVKENGIVIAYSSLIPLEENILKPLLEDKIRERDIPLGAIRQWTDPSLSVYVSSVTVKPSGNRATDRARGQFLLKRTFQWAIKLYQQSDIKNWYGIGATPEGQRLFESLGFKQITSTDNGQRKGYFLDDIRTIAPLIKKMFDETKPSSK